MPLSDSEAVENYLKQIYRSSVRGRPVRPSVLSEALAVAPATVTEMLKRLADQKLIDYQPYRGASLTPEGLKRALLIVRRHRLWEVLLHRVLGMPWNQVHEHAERLEHATTSELAEYLDEFLGRPQVGPHGQPVPAADGTVSEVPSIALTTAKFGVACEVIRFSDEDPDLLEYLGGLGLVPGARICIRDRAPYNGPFSVEIDRSGLHALGAEAAATIWVRQCVSDARVLRSESLSPRGG